MEPHAENALLLEFMYKFVFQQVQADVEKGLLSAAAGSKKSAEDIILSFFAKRRETGIPGMTNFLHVARDSSNASNVLHCVAETGNLALFKGVLQLLPGWMAKELVSDIERNGRNVVHLVAQSGVECLNWLLKYVAVDDDLGNHLLAKDYQQNNIFHLVVNSNNVESLLSVKSYFTKDDIVELMSGKNQFGLTPVMLMAANSNKEFTKAALDLLKSETDDVGKFTKLLLEFDNRRNSPLHHAMLNPNGTLHIWLSNLQLVDREAIASHLRTVALKTIDNIIHTATARIRNPNLLILFYNFVEKQLGKDEFHQMLLDSNAYQQTVIHKAVNNLAIAKSCFKYLQSKVEAKRLTEFLSDKKQRFILDAVQQAEKFALNKFLNFFIKFVPSDILAGKLTDDLASGNTLLAAVLRGPEIAVVYLNFLLRLQKTCGIKFLEKLINQPDEYGRSVANLANDVPEVLQLINAGKNT